MIFYGHQLNMTRQETINTTLGEMNDLISCLAIYNGNAKERTKRSFDDALALRERIGERTRSILPGGDAEWPLISALDSASA